MSDGEFSQPSTEISTETFKKHLESPRGILEIKSLLVPF